jgi:hypothetical protein
MLEMVFCTETSFISAACSPKVHIINTPDGGIVIPPIRLPPRTFLKLS